MSSHHMSAPFRRQRVNHAFATAALSVSLLSSSHAQTVDLAQRVNDMRPNLTEAKRMAKAALEWTAVISSDGRLPVSRTLAPTTIREAATTINDRRSVGTICGTESFWSTEHMRWSNALSALADADMSFAHGDGRVDADSQAARSRYTGAYTILRFSHAGSAAELVAWMYGRPDMCRLLMAQHLAEFAIAKAPVYDGSGRHSWVLLLGRPDTGRS